MRDCPDAKMRDVLPDFVHETLPAAEHMRVAAHLDECAECTAEVGVIRAARRALPAPLVDIVRIVGALPAAPSGNRVARPGWQRRQWQFAAAVSFFVLGGLSLIAIRGAFRDAATASTPASRAPVADSEMPPLFDPTILSAMMTGNVPFPGAIGRPVGLSFGEISSLSDAQLRSLLSELRGFKALPSAEPDAVNVPQLYPRSEVNN